MDERILFWGLGGLLGLAGLILLGWALFYDRAKGRKRCPKCWYDMSYANEDDPLHCPECGHQAKKERRLLRTRRKWRWAAVGVILLASTRVCIKWPDVMRNGWIVLVPNTVLIATVTIDERRWDFRELERRFYLEEAYIFGWQWRWLNRRIARQFVVELEKKLTANTPLDSNSWPLTYWSDRPSEPIIAEIRNVFSRSNDHHFRLAALESLNSIVDRQTIRSPTQRIDYADWLCDLATSDAHPEIRAQALSNLGIPWEEFSAYIPFLLEQIESPRSPAERRGAVKAIHEMKWSAIDALLALERLLAAPDFNLATDYDLILAVHEIQPCHPMLKERMESLLLTMMDPELLYAIEVPKGFIYGIYGTTAPLHIAKMWFRCGETDYGPPSEFLRQFVEADVKFAYHVVLMAYEIDDGKNAIMPYLYCRIIELVPPSHVAFREAYKGLTHTERIPEDIVGWSKEQNRSDDVARSKAAKAFLVKIGRSEQ